MAKGRTWCKAREALGKAGAINKRAEGVLKGWSLVVDGVSRHLCSAGHGLWASEDGHVLMRRAEGGQASVWRRTGDGSYRETRDWYVMGGAARGFEFSGIRGA